MSDEIDEAKIEALEMKFLRIINDDGSDDHGEMIIACLNVVGSVLMSITCPGCRKLAMKSTKGHFRHIIKHVLTEAERRAGNSPPSAHVH